MPEEKRETQDVYECEDSEEAMDMWWFGAVLTLALAVA